MKKRFLVIPAIAIGLAAMSAWGSSLIEAQKLACAAGDQAQCEKHASIAKRRLPEYEKKCADGDKSYCDLVANVKPAALKAQAQDKADRAARELQAKADSAARAEEETNREAASLRRQGFAISQQHAIGCAILLQRQLNDPSSFRQLNSVRETQETGVIRYTATNGFGGRVQAVHHCG
jgi:hypothetical protein